VERCVLIVGYGGTKANRIYSSKPHAWGRHRSPSGGKSFITYVGNMNDIARISDSQYSDSGKVKPLGHGPDD